VKTRLIQLLAASSIAASLPLGAQTLADLRKDATRTGNVTARVMGRAQQRHSPPTRITPASVKKLVPVWVRQADAAGRAQLVAGARARRFPGARRRHARFAGGRDPSTGKKVWEAQSKTPYWSGVLSTGSGLVFVGTQTGLFKAHDSKNVKQLWQFQTGSGITGLPIARDLDGRQYINVSSGAATVYATLAGDPDLANVPAGGSLWTCTRLP